LNAKCKKPLTNLHSAIARSRIIIMSNHGSFFRRTEGLRVQILPEFIANEVAALCGYRSHSCSSDASAFHVRAYRCRKSSWRILLVVPSGGIGILVPIIRQGFLFDGFEILPPKIFNESLQARSNVPGGCAGENALGILGADGDSVIDGPCRCDCGRTASGGQRPTCFLACAHTAFRVRHQKDIFHRI
jgi:hypothetical protein